MKIFVGQIYIKAKVSFPFSLRFQKWLGNALSERVETSDQFNKAFGADFGLGFRISARENIDQPEIKGPTVFKRDKSVEFTIFLPYHPNDYHDLAVAVTLLDKLLGSTVIILQQLGFKTTNILSDMHHLQTEFRSIPGLIDIPKSAISDNKSGNHPQ